MSDTAISVIVPVRDGEAHIAACLQSLIALDYPKENLEIIVVDNGSTDRTVEIIGEFSVTLLVETAPGAGNARNTGAAHARGTIMAFADSDCVVDPGWARAIDRAFEDPVIDAVMGLTRGINDNGWAALEQANFEAFWYDGDGADPGLKRAAIDTRNAAIRKSVFDDCGGFDPQVRYCEDLELSTRLRRHGRCIVLDHRMKAAHRNRTDLGRILALKEGHGLSYGTMAARQADGILCPDLPVDVRHFLWIDNLAAQSRALITSRALLNGLEMIFVALLRGSVLMGGGPTGITFRLFKTACAIRWERGLLRAWRENTDADGERS